MRSSDQLNTQLQWMATVTATVKMKFNACELGHSGSQPFNFFPELSSVQLLYANSVCEAIVTPRILIIFQADTARIIWSWHTNDPTSANALAMHNFQGVTSLNLLGGLPNPSQDPEDV